MEGIKMFKMMFNMVMYMVEYEVYGKEKEMGEWFNLMEVRVFKMDGEEIWGIKLRVKKEGFWKEFEKEVLNVMGIWEVNESYNVV
jgi:hypothetical protein